MKKNNEIYCTIKDFLKVRSEEVGCTYSYTFHSYLVEDLLRTLPGEKKEKLCGLEPWENIEIFIGEDDEVSIRFDNKITTPLLDFPDSFITEFIKRITPRLVFSDLECMEEVEENDSIPKDEVLEFDSNDDFPLTTPEDFINSTVPQLKPSEVIYWIDEETKQPGEPYYNPIGHTIIRVSEKFFKENGFLDGTDDPYGYVDSLLEGKYIPELGLTEYGLLQENVFQCNNEQPLEEIRKHCDEVGMKYSEELGNWIKEQREQC